MKKSWVTLIVFFVLATLLVYAAEEKLFNGLYLNLGNLYKKTNFLSFVGIDTFLLGGYENGI